MNISLRIGCHGNEELEKKFVTEAAHEGMIHLNGHRYHSPSYLSLTHTGRPVTHTYQINSLTCILPKFDKLAKRGT